jgi:hypothetical protein
MIEFDGRSYFGSASRAPATIGEPLGSGTAPPCNDTIEPDESRDEAGSGREVEVARLVGIEPAEAVGTPGDPLHIYIAGTPFDHDPAEESPALRLLLSPVRCDVASELRLAGPPVGESGTAHPFVVQLEVDDASSAAERYLGQIVDLQVRADTTGLRAPGRAVRWRRAEAVVACEDGAFVARKIDAAAPRTEEWNGRLCPGDPEEPCQAGTAELGRWYRLDLLTHCGIEGAHFNGRTWLVDPPLDEGERRPPGVKDPVQPGLMRLLAEDLAEFKVVGRLGLRFRPAPDGYERPGCA